MNRQAEMGILNWYYHDCYLCIITSSSLLKPGVLHMELIINGIQWRKESFQIQTRNILWATNNEADRNKTLCDDDCLR